MPIAPQVPDARPGGPVSRRRFAAVAIALSCLSLLTVAGSPATHADTPAFIGGGLPQDPQWPAGTKSTEPSLAVAPDGTFWAASNDSYFGADVWKSTDGGQSYQWVANPFGVSTAGRPVVSVGGRDIDITVAPEKNPVTGFYNIYAASLSIVGDSIAVSTDGGASWVLQPLGTIPYDDRPWIAADGPCTFYLTYHQAPGNRTVVHTYNGCAGAPAPDYVSLAYPVNSNALFGKLTVDTSPTSPYRHTIYLPATDTASNTSTSTGTARNVAVSVSRDNGQTWQEILAAGFPSDHIAIWPTSIATDADGVVYLAWHNSANSFMQTSRDSGRTWSPPVRLNAPGSAAVYPTVAASGHGVVAVAWYGASVAGDANDPGVFAPASGPEPWRLHFARSSDAGRSFASGPVTSAVHLGPLCTLGSACRSADARSLYDDFGVAISPTTGRASIVYGSDQPGGGAVSSDSFWLTEAVALDPSRSKRR